MEEGEAMEEGGATYSPRVPATEIAERLVEHPQLHILVTTLDGRLVRHDERLGDHQGRRGIESKNAVKKRFG